MLGRVQDLVNVRLNYRKTPKKEGLIDSKPLPLRHHDVHFLLVRAAMNRRVSTPSATRENKKQLQVAPQ